MLDNRPKTLISSLFLYTFLQECWEFWRNILIFSPCCEFILHQESPDLPLSWVFDVQMMGEIWRTHWRQQRRKFRIWDLYRLIVKRPAAFYFCRQPPWSPFSVLCTRSGLCMAPRLYFLAYSSAEAPYVLRLWLAFPRGRPWSLVGVHIVPAPSHIRLWVFQNRASSSPGLRARSGCGGVIFLWWDGVRVS